MTETIPTETDQARVFGYARVSTNDQRLDLQLDALRRMGIDDGNIFAEKMSGKTADRPELSRLLDKADRGDTVVVWKLDRLGRSIMDLIHIVNLFGDRGVNFISLTENINTTSAMGKMVFHIMAAIANMEREAIVERTKAGLNAARARGKMLGRPVKATPEISKKAFKLINDNNLTFSEAAKTLNISKTTVHKAYHRELALLQRT